MLCDYLCLLSIFVSTFIGLLCLFIVQVLVRHLIVSLVCVCPYLAFQTLTLNGIMLTIAVIKDYYRLMGSSLLSYDR